MDRLQAGERLGTVGPVGKSRGAAESLSNGVEVLVEFLVKVQLSCFAFSYLAAFVCDALRLVRGTTPGIRWAAMLFTAAGLLAQTIWLIVRSRSDGLPPLVRSGQDWLLVLAWLGAVMCLILQVTHRAVPTGAFLLPAVILLIGAALFAREEQAVVLDTVVLQRWGMLHAGTLAVGIVCVLAACVAALMYLIHYRRLRSHASGADRIRLPSLEQLSAINRWMVTTSVPLLTVGMLTGFVLINQMRDTRHLAPVSWADPVIVTTLSVWLLMVIVLGRMILIRRQSGKALAQLTLLSGCFLVVTVLAPMMLSEGGAIRTFHGPGANSAEPQPANAAVRPKEPPR